jgi:hypothetical protein
MLLFAIPIAGLVFLWRRRQQTLQRRSDRRDKP